MPEASNATESRLSKFIEGCSQLQEIYAVAPLTYTNIMGEWWQRINDIIYTLGLTETEGTVVNIAWTVPEVGRKRSPFFVEELTTKKPDGEDVPEESRVSTVAGDGTGKVKAHKYGLIQSIDALFQRNINTWSGLYEYFFNQQHADGAKPLDLTEMIFGRTDISTESDGPITRIWNDATRNLNGSDKGLANSLKHIIEDIVGSTYYDWLDNLAEVEGEPRPNGLVEFFFGDANEFSEIWGRMTTGGVTTEVVKLIDTFGEDLYNWLNNPTKACSIASSNTVYHLYKRTNGNWAKINSNTEYTYRGKTTVRYTLDYPKFGSAEAPMLFSSTLTSGSMSYKDNPESSIAIALVYGDLTVNTNEIALKQEFVKYAVNGTETEQAPVSIIAPSPKTNDVVYVGVRMLINKDTAFEFEITKIGLFVYNGTTWNLIEDTYGTIIPGIFKDVAYAAPAPATAAERRVVKTCLIEIVKTEIDESNHYPKTLMDVLFGPSSENKICDMWKEISTGSIIKENLLIKETIGEDLINLLNGDSVDGITEPRPHNLKEMLFGSMSVEEIYNKFQTFSSKSVFEEITNITNYLGDSYNQYITNNTYVQSGQAEKPVDPALNPMTVLAKLDRGQVLYGAGLNDKKEPSYKADYIVETGYICDTMQEAMNTINSLTDQERIFNTYQRVAYTGLGTPFTPGIADTTVDTSNTVYYYNGSIPFADSTTCFDILEGRTSWPDPTDTTKLQYVNLGAKTANNASLVTPNLQIYNACEALNYILLENSLGSEACPNVKNGSSVSTVGMVCVRSNPDWSPAFNADRVIKTWTEHVRINNVVQNRRVFAVSNWDFTTSAAWKLKHDGVVSYNASTGKWTIYRAGSTVPAGTKVYASIIFFVEREPNDARVIAEYSNGKLTKVTFTKYRFTSYQYYWNVAILPRWYNNNYYPNNEYRNHFIYIKRNLFAKSPSFLSGLGIQEQVFSNGNPIDSLSWIYDSEKQLIFMGCNSIVWTGFLSNKKFQKYHFETSPNSDTDDDDGTGIIIGGYKDNESGIIHTLSLTRTYSSETSFECCIDRGYNGKQIFNINATANTFNNNPNLKVRHLNGRYGGYFKNGTNEFIPVKYNGTDNYIVCDPKTDPTNGSEPSGYYTTDYAIDKVGSIYNITKTIYRDTYVNTGPSGGYTINFKIGDDVVYSGTTFTRTKNGRRKLDDTTNELTATEATNDWIDVKKVIQAVLGIVSQNGLIFGRTACQADKELGRNGITNVLDVQHVFPFHTAGTTFDTWWRRICAATQNGILNSIRYSFKKGNNADITTNEALTVLQTIYSKYELSTLNYNLLTVDDIFKFYHGGTRVYAGDPAKDCFVGGNLTTLGFIQGYGYLNAYTRQNLNSKYIVDKTQNKLVIVYKDLFYNVANDSSSSDKGIQYLRNRHAYRGDIIITFEVAENDVVNLTVQQGTTTVYATSDSTKASSTVKYLANLGDSRLIKMLKESSGYGYTGCSNPLTNFTENVFLDLNTSTVYDLDTNHIWTIDETTNKYTESQLDATAAIYKKYGPGKLISNDISEKLYYTRGDSDHVQKLVDLSGIGTGGGSSDSGINFNSYYNIIKNDILGEVDKKLYGSAGREGDIDADGNEIAGEDAVQGLAALIADGQSIVASSDGKIHVDFSNMPTDKFEAMLSALKMQVPLENNFDLYVDINNPNANDEIVSGRGTAALPFKSIEACINYATQKYALGNYDVRIHIKEGIYYTPTEIVLPSFTHTSGSFYLISEDGYGKAIVRNSSPQNTIFYSSGGSWHFIGMSMELTTTTLDDGYPHHPACLIALYGPDIFIESCKFSARYTGELTSNSISIRAIAVDLNSNLYIVPNNMGPTTFHVEKGNASYSNGNYILYAAQNSHIYFNSTSESEINNAYNVYFSGTPSYVFLVGAASAVCTWGGSLYSTKPAPNPDISLNAQTYHINGGSYMAFGDSMLLPKTGYIDESTYCWYR